MVVLGILDQHEAFAAIDLNVIFLLVGMMVIASILARTGFFEWLAVRSVMLSDGHPIRLLLILALVTAVVSAFLDNVTTVVLMTPVTLSVARRLDISPVPYLITQILASNIGGTATLIGDPPNILIGSAAGLGFGDFLFNLTPVVIVIFLAFAGIMAVSFRNALKVPDEQREAALEGTKARAITDRGLLVKALVVTGLTIVGLPAPRRPRGRGGDGRAARRDGPDAGRRATTRTGSCATSSGRRSSSSSACSSWSRASSRSASWAGSRRGSRRRPAATSRPRPSRCCGSRPSRRPSSTTSRTRRPRSRSWSSSWLAAWTPSRCGGRWPWAPVSAATSRSSARRPTWWSPTSPTAEGHPITFGEFLKYGAVVVVASMVISTVYLWVRYLT